MPAGSGLIEVTSSSSLMLLMMFASGMSSTSSFSSSTYSKLDVFCYVLAMEERFATRCCKVVSP